MKKPGIPRMKPLSSVLIKPAGPDCNMACAYCFYREKEALFPGAAAHRMSEAVLEETLRQLFAQSIPAVSIGWQGGEPTLMGLPFFQRAVDLQVRCGKGKSVGNGLQTNGLLLDGAWAEFLKKYRILVGLSLDGPGHVHDHYRRLSGGQGTHQKTADAAKLLLDADVAVNALVVVNDYSARFPEEIYRFHKDLGLNYMQFIPCVETDAGDPGRAAPFSASAEAFGAFLSVAFDLWRADFRNGEPTTFIRFFDSVFYRYVDREPPECDLLPECGTYLVIEHNGDVYACDFFVEERWKLGNVMTGKLVHMLNSAKQTEFGRMKADRPDPCAACEWLVYCRGGCPKDRLRDPRDAGISHFCAGYKKFFAHADASFRALANEWKNKQGGSHD
ncbi:MAG: anaerobic sulfatase maturase [Candidatus Aminicenantes bacterium]|nr:anaerobic sulfatase maturase [Candidatus Aminicenantes bacterium]